MKDKDQKFTVISNKKVIKRFAALSAVQTKLGRW